MIEVRLVFITAPSGETSAALARDLVDRGLAACVNVVSGVRSIFSWEGAIEDDVEDLLIVKTSAARFDELEKHVREAHPYDVPEVLAIPVVAGSEAYMNWVVGETDKDR